MKHAFTREQVRRSEGTYGGRRCGVVAEPMVPSRGGCRRAVGRVDLVLIDGTQRRTFPMQAEERGYFRCTCRTWLRDNATPIVSMVARSGPILVPLATRWRSPPSAVVRPELFTWTDQLEGCAARGSRVLRVACRHLHAGRHFEAIIPRLPALRESGRDGRGIDAGRPVPRHAQLGLRRRAALRGSKQLRWAPRFAEACGRLPCRRPGGFPRCGLQPSRTRRQLSSRVRALSHGSLQDALGHGRSTSTTPCDAVRDFVLDNVRMWLEEFHFDGLRLDAVHAIFDLGPATSSAP